MRIVLTREGAANNCATDGYFTRLITTTQPTDPFCGQGDFEYHPAVVDLVRERRLNDFLNKRVMIAGVGLANVDVILDRPLSKLKRKDLIVLIRAAQDAVIDAKEQMG